MLYTISYDLNYPGKNYSALYSEIKNLGSWCHPLDSTWLVDSSLSAEAIKNTLKQVMDNSDALLVTKTSKPSVWFGLSEEISNWLNNHL